MTEVATGARSFLNFDLRIVSETSGREAVVGLPGAGRVTARHGFELSDDDEIHRLVREVRTWPPNRDVAESLGRSLFDRLLGGEVQGLFRSFRDEALRQSAVLRVRLHLGNATDLAAIPWEYLFDREQGDFLFTSSHGSLLRTPQLKRVNRGPIELPLRILVVAHVPEDLPPLDTAGEMQKISDALGDLVSSKALELELLDPPTLRELQRRLRKRDYHIVHYIGHGSQEDGHGDGIVFFLPEGRTKNLRTGSKSSAGATSRRKLAKRLKDATPVRPRELPAGATSGRKLGTLLKDEKALRLVVLNACDGAVPGEDYYSGTAQSLVRAGVPAVIGMQSTISDEAAVCMAQEFYGALADGYPVDSALGEARKAIFTRVNETEWGIPALFSLARDGSILDLRLNRDGRPIPVAENLEATRKRLLREWGETVTSAGTGSGGPSIENPSSESGAESEPNADDSTDPFAGSSSGPAQVWMAAEQPKILDWEEAFHRGDPIWWEGFHHYNSLGDQPQSGDIVLLYCTEPGIEEIVGWAELLEVGPGVRRRLHLFVREIFSRRISREELERHVLGLLPNDESTVAPFALVSPEAWAVLRSLMEYFSGGTLSPGLPASRVPAKIAVGQDSRVELPRVVQPGQPFPVDLELLNSGNVVWQAGDAFTVLGELGRSGRKRIQLEAAWNGLTEPVLPMGTGRLTVVLAAPDIVGSFHVYLRVHEGTNQTQGGYLRLLRGGEFEIRALPDLIVEEFEAPSTLVWEEPFKIVVSVRNNGEFAVPKGESFDARVLFGPDPLSTGWTPRLLEDLAPGAIISFESPTLTTPRKSILHHGVDLAIYADPELYGQDEQRPPVISYLHPIKILEPAEEQPVKTPSVPPPTEQSAAETSTTPAIPPAQAAVGAETPSPATTRAVAAPEHAEKNRPRHDARTQPSTSARAAKDAESSTASQVAEPSRAPRAKHKQRPAAKGATSLRKAPADLPREIEREGPRGAQIVQVQQNVFNDAIQTIRSRSDQITTTTLDIQIGPSNQRKLAQAVKSLDPEAAEQLAPPEHPFTVLLTLRQIEDGRPRATTYFEGPLLLDASKLSRGKGRGDPVYGDALHRTLFHDTVPENREQVTDGEPGLATLEAGYMRARTLADTQPLRVQLRIDSSLAELHDYAWEYMWDQQSGLQEPIACSARTPFARFLHVSGEGGLTPLPVDAGKPLRILAVMASPASLADASRRYAKDRGLLRGLKPIERAELDMLCEGLEGLESLDPLVGDNVLASGPRQVTLEAIDRRLKDAEDAGRPYGVLHLLCHGVTGEDGRGYLILEREGQTDNPVVDERTFARWIRGYVTGGLRLIVLASCFTADASQGSLRGVARRLVQSGVPAVVAMQDSFQYEAAQRFSQRLYRHLLHSGEIDRAVNAARLELKKRGGSNGSLRSDEWGIPVLFMRLPDGRLFDIGEKARTAARPDAPTRVRAYRDMPSADPERLVREAMATVSASLGASVVFDTASLGQAVHDAVRNPRVPPEKPELQGLFSRPGQESFRASLLHAVAEYRQQGVRRAMLYLRRTADRAISDVAEALMDAKPASAASLKKLSERFHSTVVARGQVKLGQQSASIGGPGPGGERLLGASIAVWRAAGRRFAAETGPANPGTIEFEGNLWSEREAPARGEWTAATLQHLQELLDRDRDRFRLLEKTASAPLSPELDTESLSLLLHAREPDRFAPYARELAQRVFAEGGFGRAFAPDGHSYARDYRGFNRLVFDLVRDAELGLEDASDATLFLQRLADGRVEFDPDTADDRSRRVELVGEFALDPQRLDTDLVVPQHAVDQAVAALEAGKHIILTGPPGTGKTTLAEDLCRLAHDRNASRGHLLATATSDWTTFDTIGGYAPSADQRLVFRTGIFLEAIRSERWLVIDEINRADIDKAFGELFTVLSGQSVTLPYLFRGRPVRILPPGRPASPASSDYAIPTSWRIVATMNVYDRASLFAMSKAFMRRFAFVEVDVPQPAIYEKLIDEFLRRSELELGGSEVEQKLKAFLRAGDAKSNPLMHWRSLGPAIARDVILYLRRRRERRAALTLRDLADALSLYVVPQLDDLGQSPAGDICDQFEKLIPGADSEELRRRVSALFPYFDLETKDN